MAPVTARNDAPRPLDPTGVRKRDRADRSAWQRALHLAGRSLLLLGMLIFCHGSCAAEVSREYRIKAAYLYNLLRFITWPAQNADTDEPVTICVYGYNPFDRYLDKLESRTVDQRPIAVRYVAERQPLDECEMVFVSQYNTTEPEAIAAQPPLPPILTVSDSDHFMRRGGMVGLVSVGNNIQLDINLTRGRQAGFQFSANLLEVARTVR